jgi:ferredoxin
VRVTISELADLRRLEIEELDSGIEPVAKPTVSDDCIGTCGSCQHSCAAQALHFGVNGCQLLAAIDSDLRQVIEAWTSLPDHAKQSIVALSQLK